MGAWSVRSDLEVSLVIAENCFHTCVNRTGAFLYHMVFKKLCLRSGLLADVKGEEGRSRYL